MIGGGFEDLDEIDNSKHSFGGYNSGSGSAIFSSESLTGGISSIKIS